MLTYGKKEKKEKGLLTLVVQTVVVTVVVVTVPFLPLVFSLLPVPVVP